MVLVVLTGLSLCSRVWGSHSRLVRLSVSLICGTAPAGRVLWFCCTVRPSGFQGLLLCVWRDRALGVVRSSYATSFCFRCAGAGCGGFTGSVPRRRGKAREGNYVGFVLCSRDADRVHGLVERWGCECSGDASCEGYRFPGGAAGLVLWWGGCGALAVCVSGWCACFAVNVV